MMECGWCQPEGLLGHRNVKDLFNSFILTAHFVFWYPDRQQSSLCDYILALASLLHIQIV